MMPKHWIVRTVAAALLLTSCFAQKRPQTTTRRPVPVKNSPAYMNEMKAFEETQFVTKAVLKNGLTVLVNEFRVLPVVAVSTFVEFGILDEPPEALGLAQVLSRMFFSGTSTKGADAPAVDVHSLGGVMASAVEADYSAHDIVAPSAQWKSALRIQADALLNPLVDQGVLKREREALASEARSRLHNPDTAAGQLLLELGLDQHRLAKSPYGSEDAMAILSREELLRYYGTYYDLSRVTLSISGNIMAAEVLTEVVRLYGKVRSRGSKRESRNQASAQNGLRYREQRSDIQIARVLLGFHAVPRTSPEYPAMEVLRALLGQGEGSLIVSRVAGLKKLIMEGSAELAASSGLGYLTIRLKVDPQDIDRAEIAALTEIELLKRKPPEAEEMERAFAQLEREFWEQMETAAGRARALAFYDDLGDWKKMNEYIPGLRKVKPGDISRLAGKYLTLDKCSLLEYLPSTAEPRNLTLETVRKVFEDLLPSAAEEESAKRELETRPSIDIPDAAGAFKFSEVRFPFQLASVLRGPEIFVRENHTVPLIQMGFYFAGGRLSEKDENAGITTLMLNSMLRGTRDRNPQQLHQQLEIYGARVQPVVAEDYFGFNVSMLSKNVDACLELLGEIIKLPKLDEEEIQRQSRLQLASIKELKDFECRYSRRLVEKALFQKHPYGLNPLGSEESLAALDSNAVREWYKRAVDRRKPVVVIIGDTQGTSLAGYFVRNFSGSRFEDALLPEGYVAPLDSKALVEESYGGGDSLVVLAFQAPPADDEDFFHLDVLKSYLSGRGGRLVGELKNLKGLAYDVSVGYEPRVRGGLLYVSAVTQPQSEEKLLEALGAEISQLFEGTISYRDYRSAVNLSIGSFTIGQEDRFSQIALMVRSILSGRRIEVVQDYESRLQDVRLEDLPEVAQRFFRLKKSVTLLLHGSSRLRDSGPAAGP